MAAGFNEIAVFRHILTSLGRSPHGDIPYGLISAKLNQWDVLTFDRAIRLLDSSQVTPAGNLKNFVQARANAFRNVLFPLPRIKKKGRSWYPFLRIEIAGKGDNCPVDKISSVRVLMFSINPNHDANPGGPHIDGIGLRFDTPHTPGDKKPSANDSLSESESDADHDYFHAQFIVNFDRGANAIEGIPAWLPTTQPSIPVPIPKSAAQLLLLVALAIYGRRLLEESIRDMANVHQASGRTIFKDLLVRAGYNA